MSWICSLVKLFTYRMGQKIDRFNEILGGIDGD